MSVKLNRDVMPTELGCLYDIANSLERIADSLENKKVANQCLWKQGNVVCDYRKSNGGYVLSYIHDYLGIKQQSFETEENFKKDYEVLD